MGCAAYFFHLIAYNFVDIDLWHQMALIRESLAAGHLLKVDPFAYTPTLSWIDHEWGSGAIAYFAVAWLGPRAILALKFLTALGTGFACVRCARVRGADFRILGLCAPLAIFLAYLGFFVAIRAHAWSFFLTAVWLLFLEWDRRGSRKCRCRCRWMIAALAIFPLWINLHAGFVVAICFTVLYALENLLRRQPYRHLLALLGAMLLEVFLNPYGSAYFEYLKRALAMPRPYAAEWGSIFGLGTPWTLLFFAAVFLAVYSVWSVGWRGATGILILASTAVEAAMHRKLLPLFAIAWLCYVPAYLQATPPGAWWIQFAHRRPRFLTAAWVAVACVCTLSAIGQKPWALDVPQPPYPVGPVEYLVRQKFAGNLMVPFRLGAYVSWKLYPAVKVSVDSRYEVAYPDTVVKQMFDFYAASPGWQSTLAAYPTDAVLIPSDAPISTLMPATAWQRVYTDRQFKIYVRPGLSLPVQDERSTTHRGTFP